MNSNSFTNNDLVVKLYYDILSFINHDCSGDDIKSGFKIIFISYVDSVGNVGSFIIENSDIK